MDSRIKHNEEVMRAQQLADEEYTLKKIQSVGPA